MTSICPRPDIELGAGGDTDAATVGSVIERLSNLLAEQKPDVAVFLGDTNTVMGCIAAAQQNIPVVHIEGCMRSYDWRMPEEKYRTIIDHTSDVIYTYFPEYKEQGVREGLNPAQHRGDPEPDRRRPQPLLLRSPRRVQGVRRRCLLRRAWDRARPVLPDDLSPAGVGRVARAAARDPRRDGQSPWPIYFPASYRTQKRLKEFGFTVPSNTTMVDPIGYRELLALLGNSRGSLTDSGTVVEETAVIGVPSLQIRKATERPQVYDCGSSVKFDPARPEDYPIDQLYGKLERLYGAKLGAQPGRRSRLRAAGRGPAAPGDDRHDPRPPCPRTPTSTSRAPTARTGCRRCEHAGALPEGQLAFPGRGRADLQRGGEHRAGLP